jgi:hypothetical protein
MKGRLNRDEAFEVDAACPPHPGPPHKPEPHLTPSLSAPLERERRRGRRCGSGGQSAKFVSAHTLPRPALLAHWRGRWGAKEKVSLSLSQLKG